MFQIDPNGSGKIEAIVAAKFLKKSALSDVILSRVWDLSDPGRKGYLNKNGFFVALKLCSLAQAGRDLNIANITLDSPPPKMGDLPKIPVNKVSAPAPTITNSIAPTSDWAIMPVEKAKYDQLFDSLQPQNGMIVGNKVNNLVLLTYISLA
jgi:epidermal growth factor receptor substrate 15